MLPNCMALISKRERRLNNIQEHKITSPKNTIENVEEMELSQRFNQ